jgi:hypothetical protein
VFSVPLCLCGRFILMFSLRTLRLCASAVMYFGTTLVSGVGGRVDGPALLVEQDGIDFFGRDPQGDEHRHEEEEDEHEEPLHVHGKSSLSGMMNVMSY